MADDKPQGEAAPADFTAKHPLENRWTLWFDNPQTKQTMNKYGQSLRSGALGNACADPSLCMGHAQPSVARIATHARMLVSSSQCIHSTASRTSGGEARGWAAALPDCSRHACIAKCRRPGANAAAALGRALLFVTLTRRPCCFCCSLYNNIRTPGQLQPTATFYLFKEHIEPKWEDPKNTHGGCWTASVPSKGPNSKSQLDAWWLNGVSV